MYKIKREVEFNETRGVKALIKNIFNGSFVEVANRPYYDIYIEWIIPLCWSRNLTDGLEVGFYQNGAHFKLHFDGNKNEFLIS